MAGGETGRTRAASGGMLEDAACSASLRSPFRNLRVARNKLERDVLDQGESSEVDIQDEIGFALMQMKAETLDKIDAALGRLGEGTYGDCFECGEEIAEARLWALPFALRCRDFEEAHETVEQRQHILAQRRGSSAVFLDLRN